MPPRIDAAERRRHITEAALRLVMREGLAAATFRRVASESGLNVGSVRHYFTDHESLVVAVATEAGDRMGRRLMKHRPPESGDGATLRRHLLALLAELVPLDDERHSEAVILMELITASRTTDAFRPVTTQMAADLHTVLLGALEDLGVPEPSLEAQRLASLLSGLSLDAVTAHGPRTASTIRRILRLHVNSLVTSR
ncbi:TetR/AcrR family transcriptional regulator [Mycobacterium sp. SMC-4]|uniref:TetR/AcrR family transcriptional regulator n=1 Tax=Mycobacterium sp. SMC-4 TaxID=2857059 RepID=UPI003D07DA3B